jgi:magnesium transporter
VTGAFVDGRARLALRFLEDHPDESARLLEALAPDAATALLAHAPPGLAADVLRRMVPSFAVGCLERLPREQAAPVIEALPLGAAAGLLRRIEAEPQSALLRGLSESTGAALARLLAYPEDSAGGRMDPRVFTLPEDIRVAEAVERLRARPEYAMYYLYVVDREQRLVGVLNYRDLLLASDEATLRSVMRSPVVHLRATARGDALLAEPAWRVYLALPVVDADGILVGVVRSEALRDLEWDRRAPAAGPGSRLAGAVWRGVSDLLGGGRNEERG